MKPQGFPRDISQYVDLKSPILKYLIEIEKKHWKSDINQHFRLTGKKSLDDSEESIQSLRGTEVVSVILAIGARQGGNRSWNHGRAQRCAGLEMREHHGGMQDCLLRVCD